MLQDVYEGTSTSALLEDGTTGAIFVHIAQTGPWDARLATSYASGSSSRAAFRGGAAGSDQTALPNAHDDAVECA